MMSVTATITPMPIMNVMSAVSGMSEITAMSTYDDWVISDDSYHDRDVGITVAPMTDDLNFFGTSKGQGNDISTMGGRRTGLGKEMV
jgi:hypothetical protein